MARFGAVSFNVTNTKQLVSIGCVDEIGGSMGQWRTSELDQRRLVIGRFDR